MKIQLKRSAAVDGNNAAVEPGELQLADGELAINYNVNDPSFFIKNSAGDIIRMAGKGAGVNSQTLQEVCSEGSTTSTPITISEETLNGQRTNTTDAIIKGFYKASDAQGADDPYSLGYTVTGNGTTVIGATNTGATDGKIVFSAAGTGRFAGSITCQADSSAAPAVTIDAAGNIDVLPTNTGTGMVTQGTARFRALNTEGNTATFAQLTAPTTVPSSYTWTLPAATPAQVDSNNVDRTLIVNTDGTLSYGDTDGTVSTLAEVCAAGNETTTGIQAANFALRNVVDEGTADEAIVYVTQKAPSDLATSYTLRWPTTAGTANQVLTATGTDGQMNWTTVDPSAATLQAVLTEGNVTDKDIIIAADASIDPATPVISLTQSSGTVTATDFNSTSDAALKHNINPIENALQMLDSINGVSFNWNFNDAPSLGVLAQDVEAVAPELVKNANNKSVNYNGLIGILVEAVKELSAEVKALRG